MVELRAQQRAFLDKGLGDHTMKATYVPIGQASVARFERQ